MTESQYDTEHKRRLGSGIIFLSQISEIDRNHGFLCKKEQKEIESQFQRGACMPWLRKHRLKAKIQKSQWETRVIMKGIAFGGCYFSKLQFGDVRIRILMESVARLEAIRLSGAENLKRVFRRLETEERWWIVDFFEHGMATKMIGKGGTLNCC